MLNLTSEKIIYEALFVSWVYCDGRPGRRERLLVNSWTSMFSAALSQEALTTFLIFFSGVNI